MARVAWTFEAAVDAEGIRRYIGQFDPAAADRLSAALKRAAAGLETFPNRGRPISGGRRELPSVPPYVIRYRVIDDTVLILAVLHGARRRD